MLNNQAASNDNVIIEWNDDHSVVTITFKNSRRETVDAYMEKVFGIFRDWDDSKTLYSVQDVSDPSVVLTPYLKARLSEMTDYVRDHQINVYSATVIQKNFTGRVIEAFGPLLSLNAKYLKQQYFTDMAQAQAWIDKLRAEL